MAERLFPRWDYGYDTPLPVVNPFESRAPKKLTPMKDCIDSANSSQFIKKLFDKNDEAFWNLINILERTKTWREALRLIETELGERHVDVYCQQAILFTNLIYRRYFPEDEEV